jgi:ParB family chromosome partitioning protein
MSKSRKGGLGKGLDALFVDNKTEDSGTVTLRISEIEPNRSQPRKDFDEQALAELADSIKEHGIIQPLLVRPLPSGNYQLVAGERRWRASRMIGLDEVPVVIRDIPDEQAMEIALIENLQREDLNIIEEAMGYKTLMEEFEMTQEDVSAKVGKSRPAISNSIRLLNLPKEVVAMVKDGSLSARHARALLSLGDEQLIISTAISAADGKLTVRDIEKMCREKADKPKKAKTAVPVFYQEAALALTDAIGHKVKISGNHKKSTIQIEFYSEDELKDIIKHFEVNN